MLYKHPLCFFTTLFSFKFDTTLFIKQTHWIDLQAGARAPLRRYCSARVRPHHTGAFCPVICDRLITTINSIGAVKPYFVTSDTPSDLRRVIKISSSLDGVVAQTVRYSRYRCQLHHLQAHSVSVPQRVQANTR